MTNDFSIEEHIHRFGVWTAARAASKSLLSNEEVEKLITEVNLKQEVEFIRSKSDLDTDFYEQWIKKYCALLIQAVHASQYNSIKKDRISYGIAAKIISVYIKTVEVIPTKGMSKLSNIAFPPIDSILLKNINKKYKKKFNTSWSKFNWDDYIKTINDLKKVFNEHPMWRLESEWHNPKKLCKTETISNP